MDHPENEGAIGEALAYYFSKVDAGETVDREAIAAMFPGCTPELDAYFEAMASVRVLLDSTSSGPSCDETPLGTRLGDFELLERVGSGGFGIVFRARQIGLQRDVALKVIREGRLATEGEIAAIHKEAEAVATLRHPNIVQAIQVGESNGYHFFAMEWIEGGTLSSRLADGPLAAKEAATLMLPILDAAQTAHAQGIIHRDLKPANILLHHGEPKIADFGLARRTADVSETTPKGTFPYMAPEQLAIKSRPTALSDVYSLGGVLYTMLTGNPPFAADNLATLVTRIRETPPLSPRIVNTDVPLELETITLKCLEKDPADRYSSAAALRDDLSRYLENRPLAARPPSAFERGRKWVNRHRVESIAGALVVVTLLTATVVSTALYFHADAQRVVAADAVTELTAKQKQLTSMTRESAHDLLVLGEREIERGNIQRAADHLARADKLIQALLDGQGLESSDQDELRLEQGHVLRLLGWALKEDEETVEARNRLVEGQAKLSPYLTEHPLRFRAMFESAVIQNYLGEILMATDMTEAASCFQESLTSFESLRSQFETQLQDARMFAESRYFQHMTEFNLGIALTVQREFENAHSLLVRANWGFRALVDEYPEVARYQSRLVRSYHNLSFHYSRRNKFEECLAAARQAEDISNQLAQRQPFVVDYHEELIGVYQTLAASYEALGDHKQQQDALERAVAACRRAIDFHPENPDLLALYAEKLNFASNGIRERDPAAAAAAYLDAIEVGQRCFQLQPRARVATALGGLYSNLGSLKQATRNTLEMPELDQAIEWIETALQLKPNDETAQKYLVTTIAHRVKTFLAHDRKDMAAEEFRRSAKLLTGDDSKWASLNYGGMCCNVGNQLQSTPGQSLEWFENAIMTLQVLEIPRHEATRRKFLRNAFAGRGESYAMLEKWSLAIDDYVEARKITTWPAIIDVEVQLARCRLMTGQLTECQASLASALGGLAELPELNHRNRDEAHTEIAYLLAECWAKIKENKDESHLELELSILKSLAQSLRRLKDADALQNDQVLQRLKSAARIRELMSRPEFREPFAELADAVLGDGSEPNARCE